MSRPRVYALKGSYGDFTGFKVYYLGFTKQPAFLQKSGRGFAGLKHLLETLKSKFPKFSLTFTPTEDSVAKKDSLYKVRLSATSVKLLGNRRWDANRQLNLRLARQLLSGSLPKHFDSADPPLVYQRGMFGQMFGTGFDVRQLSPEDRVALTDLITKTDPGSSVSTLDIPTAYKATKDVQLLYLKQLVGLFDKEIAAGHDESWWQGYFSKNILFFQNDYIRRLEKLNIAVAATQFPDFSVVTPDGYLDIIEIKKPSTELLKEDKSRHNFYWSAEIAKAISQVENYIDNVEKHADAIRNKLRDEQTIDLRIIRPRGIVIAGRSSQLASNNKKSDDFQRLNRGLKHVRIIPYDELSQNLKNTIVSIGKISALGGRKKRP